jgi:hypothetical protein
VILFLIIFVLCGFVLLDTPVHRFLILIIDWIKIALIETVMAKLVLFVFVFGLLALPFIAVN